MKNEIKTHTNANGQDYFSKVDGNGERIFSFSESFRDIWNQADENLYGNTKMKIMTIKILEIVKAGTTENLMRVPQITVREDGTIWCNKNTTPLLNVSGTLNKTELLPLVEAKTWDKIPADNYLRLGINAGGKECLDQSDVDDRRRENVTPEEEAQIAKAKENARKAREYDRINNEGGEGYNPYRGQAEMEDRTPHHKGDNNPE